MKLLFVFLMVTLYAAEYKVTPKVKQLNMPCKECKKEYKGCLFSCKDTREQSIEIEECQDSYQECFNLNRCYVEGAR